MAFKKKLYRLNPNEKAEKITFHQTKRNKRTASVTVRSNELNVREVLCNKLSGTHLGILLLIPEYLRLGAWDLLSGVFNPANTDSLDTHIAMQVVNESAVCVNRLRKKDSLCNQGFSLANGLFLLASDESVHHILNRQPTLAFEDFQVALMQLRRLANHYDKKNIFALDPHRIESSTKRVMPHKKKRTDMPSKKMLQDFFCVDAITGQPLGFTIGSSGKSCASATLRLINTLEKAGQTDGLFIADKEHFTKDLLEYFAQHPSFDILIPAPASQKMRTLINQLSYIELWPGYAIAEDVFKFNNALQNLRLIVQRQEEHPMHFIYRPFLTTSSENAVELLTKNFPKRWTIEEFFNFQGAMGWNSASTFNLNVKYAKQSLALLAQAATHQLKTKLPSDYRQWTASHLAQQVLTNMEGDIRVKDDTIIVTYYRDHENLGLRNHFEDMPTRLEKEGINPQIPWLFDFKLDFRFK